MEKALSTGSKSRSWYHQRIRASRASNSGEFMRYSRRIKKLKGSIIFAASIIILSVVIWPLTNVGQRNFRLTIENDGSINDEITSMVKPRFHGIDKNNQPYTITADEATQKDKNLVLLDKINADILLKNGDWMSLLSDVGEYNLQRKELDLSGNVHLLINNGYEFITQAAHIDLNENMATGNEKVNIQGPLGTLTANGFIIRDNGNSIMFHGGVKMTTRPPKPKS